MIQILATDYGNLRAFLVGVPVLLLATLLFVFALIFRVRRLHGFIAAVSLLTGIGFFWSLPEAHYHPNEEQLTLTFGWSGLILAVLGLLAFCFTKPRSRAVKPDDSAPEKVA